MARSEKYKAGKNFALLKKFFPAFAFLAFNFLFYFFKIDILPYFFFFISMVVVI